MALTFSGNCLIQVICVVNICEQKLSSLGSMYIVTCSHHTMIFKFSNNSIKMTPSSTGAAV